MTASANISSFLQGRIDAGDFPSAVYLVAKKGNVILHDALGHAVVAPELVEARLDTIYDLASLTKVLVTGLLVAQMTEAGDLKLEEPVAALLDGFGTDEKRPITVRDLLVHTSGLPNWLPMYLVAEVPAQSVSVVAAEPLEARVGARTIYSDLNFFLLHAIVEKVCEKRLGEITRDRILEPLGLSDTRFVPDASFKRRIAASEKGNEYERQICIEKGYLETAAAADSNNRFREEIIWGEVHDGNACFMGGVAGHAGLFGTAEEVLKIAQQFLPDHTELLKPATCELFRTNFTTGMKEHRSFGFQLASSTDSTAGKMMSPQSFGHTGFTGTSLWIDPVQDRVFVLLTNRTHDHGLPFVNINSARRRFHDLANEHLDRN